MTIKKFSIKNRKNIVNAECENVPSIMVIAGPNGIGKSTLLYSLYIKDGQIESTGGMIYIPPHRVWTKSSLRSQHLFENPQSYGQALIHTNIPNVPGLQIRGGQRGPDTSDETSSIIKYSLGQLELRRQNIIKERVDSFKEGDKFDDLKEIYQPLKELTRELLPHIEFEGIDLVKGGLVNCFWKRSDGLDLKKGKSITIDIEELSSGEKAILILFMPFIEIQIENKIKKLEGKEVPKEDRELTVLIDEPELHLHPILESRVLAYLRKLTEEDKTQFIITTHSPVLLDNARFNELFVLGTKTDSVANQLQRLANDEDKLEAMRILCGDTYPLTAFRNILCIEGENTEETPKKPSDKKILETLCPEISKNVLVPMGGKNMVIDSAKRLRSYISKDMPQIQVLALVDKDQEKESNENFVFPLPVCMIENLLLVPDAINDFLKNYQEKSNLKNLDDIKKTLKSITDSLKNDEIRLRVKRNLKSVHGSFDGTSIEEIKENHAKIVNDLKQNCPSDNELEEILKKVTTEVESIINENTELLYFRGKPILKNFYDDYIKPLGFSYYTFCIELIKEITAKPERIKNLQELILKINSF